MTTLRYIFVLLCFICLLLAPVHAEVLPYDSGKMHYPVSPIDAMQAVRDWAGDPQLTVLLQGVEIYDFGQWYVLKTEDGQYLYEVDCHSGEMFHWRDVPAFKSYYEGSSDDHASLPDEQLNAAIGDFLKRRYQGFSQFNMQPFNPDEPGSAWVQRLPNGVWYWSNRVWCGVNKQTGRVFQYRGVHGPQPAIQLNPNLPPEQAEQIAIDYSGTIPVDDWDEKDDEGVVLPQSAFVLKNWGLFLTSDKLCLQRLYYDIEVVLHSEPDYTAIEYYNELHEPIGVASGVEYSIIVDALTGEVLSHEASGMLGGGSAKLNKTDMSTIKSRKPNPTAVKRRTRLPEAKLCVNGVEMDTPSYPPVVISGIPYVYVGYISALQGGTKQWISRMVKLVMPHRTVKLYADSVRLQVNERTYRLRQPVMIIRDRMYIPYSAVEVICGAHAAWDKGEATLRITAPSMPHAATKPR